MLLRGLTVFFTVIVICHGADIQWQVKVKTSDEHGAGTNAGVFIQIIGTRETSSAIELDSDIDNFEKNLQESFVIRHRDVGRPLKLRVYTDNKGASPDWNLSWIELEAMNGEYQGGFMFNCDCWFGNAYGLDQTLPLSTIGWTARVKTSNSPGAGTNSHVWITITGNRGVTRQIALDNEGDDTERGYTDVYNLQTVDIGTPHSMRVDTDDNDSWNLEKIELETLSGADTYNFPCNCWLGMVGKTTITIPASRSG